ncbi:MAG: TetR/AcrR family transcriptional regulator [Alphaproteobacteria bacterium]|nr:TetR/AcrR family transcriptional regulator [Alphaproteobacteria bacterium]
MSSQQSRAARKAATRERLVDAAWARFRSDGYDATTLAAVAADAGVAVGTVCLHFPDKPALVAGAFHTHVQRVVDAAFASLPAAPVADQLLHVAGALYDWYADNPAGLDFVRESMFATGDAEALLAPQAMAFMERLAGLVADGVDRGELKAETPVGVIGQGFFADYLLALVGGLKGHLGPPAAWREALRALTAARLHGFVVARPVPTSDWAPEWD